MPYVIFKNFTIQLLYYFRTKEVVKNNALLETLINIIM